MIRIKGTKSVICTKKELKIMDDLNMIHWYQYCYELPLFSLRPKVKKPDEIETDYVLIRPVHTRLTDSFFERINKTWGSCYEK